MANINHPDKLTQKELSFCKHYVETGNGLQSVLQAGYKYSDKAAGVEATRLLKKDRVRKEIDRLNKIKESSAIMSSQQVMEMFTKIANGEIKDQFGLDASLNDRLKALQELAKRTIDIDNKIKGTPDMNVQITVDWKR